MFIKVTYLRGKEKEPGLVNLNQVQAFRLIDKDGTPTIEMQYITIDPKDGCNWCDYIAEDAGIISDRLKTAGVYIPVVETKK